MAKRERERIERGRETTHPSCDMDAISLYCTTLLLKCFERKDLPTSLVTPNVRCVPPPHHPLPLSPSASLHTPHHLLPSPTEVNNTRFRVFEKNALWTDRPMDGPTDRQTLLKARSRQDAIYRSFTRLYFVK